MKSIGPRDYDNVYDEEYKNMKYHCFWLLSASVVAGLAFLAQVNHEPRFSHSTFFVGERAATSSPCLGDKEIETNIKLLSSGQSLSHQQNAQNQLIEGAKKSGECRKRIISALINAMNGNTANLNSDRSGFYLWHYGSEILSSLKAEEALDFLIEHLGLDDGTAFPLNHHPALVSVTRMGSLAIPKLSAVLKENQDPNLRQYAVFCLGIIGGSDAQKALADALPSEQNRCVSAFIKASLDAFKDSSLPGQIDPEKRAHWYGSFLCNAP